MPRQNQRDTESVFYVHPSEGPNYVVVSPPLDSSNYLWMVRITSHPSEGPKLQVYIKSKP